MRIIIIFIGLLLLTSCSSKSNYNLGCTINEEGINYSLKFKADKEIITEVHWNMKLTLETNKEASNYYNSAKDAYSSYGSVTIKKQKNTVTISSKQKADDEVLEFMDFAEYFASKLSEVKEHLKSSGYTCKE